MSFPQPEAGSHSASCAAGSFQQFGGPTAAFDAHGAAPQNQVVFTGWDASDTICLSWDRRISPTLEPAASGALLAGGALAIIAWRRRPPAPA